MRLMIPVALAASLITTNLFAAEVATSTAPLAPGKAAGVHEAQVVDNTLLFILGGAAVIAVIAVAASSGGGSNNNQSTGGTTQ